MITKDGDVISVRKSGRKYMKMQTDKDGYKCVNIRVNKKAHHIHLHRLLAVAFIPLPQSYIDQNLTYKDLQINHLNGIHDDNRLENLEWCTCQENIEHAWKTGLSHPKKCDKHPNSVYSNQQIENVCKMLEDNKNSMKKISEQTEVSYTVVKQIRNHIIWKEISQKYNIDNFSIDTRKNK